VRSWWIRGAGPDAGREILMQDGTTANMLFDIPTAIEFVSRAITLEAGDIIATGTPSGVGVFRDPPVFLVPGDRVRCEVEGIGSVENPILDWTDDPR
jgi:2-keto-4-pentenoate hydratase/2-oxohepta-3-ene-1,7-dioic acid hydratase in catechol pathway